MTDELKTDLEALAEQWEPTKPEGLESDVEHGDYHEGYHDALRHCKRELLEVIEQHE